MWLVCVVGLVGLPASLLELNSGRVKGVTVLSFPEHYEVLMPIMDDGDDIT